MERALGYVLLFILPFASFGQSYNFLHFTVEDGLSNSTVLDVCEDKFGHLWFATQGGGLNRYDGHSFERITIRDGLASNFVRAVLCDSDGNIWAATASGISRYNGDTIQNFLHEPQEIFSVAVIEEDMHKKIWFSLPTGGISFIENDSITTFNKASGFVNDVVIDIKADSNYVWIVTNIQGLFRYDGKSFEHMLSNSEFKGWLLSLHLREDGSMLIASNKGVLAYNPTQQDEHNNLIPAVMNYFVRSVIEDEEKNIWVALSNGVIKLGSDQVKRFSGSQGFTSKSINVIFADREGTLWFGTEGDGIYKFGGELFFHLNKTHGLNGAPVSSIIEDDDENIWISTNGGGIDIYNGESVINLGYGILPTSYITSSTKDKEGNLWFGTREGILKYDSTGFHRYTTADGLIDNVVRCVQVDKHGDLWIGTNSGVSRFNGTRFESLTENEGLSENIIWQILSSEDGSIYIITRKGIERFKDGQLHTVSRDEEIFKQRLNAILFDEEGNLWIGYSGYGLVRIDEGMKTPITTNEGLSSDFVYNLILNDDKDILVGTEKGVDKIILDEKGFPKSIKNYGTVEGFKGLKTSANAVYKQNDGSVWFGSDKGVYKYQPGNSRLNPVSPLVYISNLKLFYNEIDWSKETDTVTKWTHLPVNLQLPHDKNHIIFHFNGVSLKNPNEVKYQFRLKNLEDDWSPSTSKNEAAYTNLPPGQYSFLVRAANSDGVWSHQPASFNFVIKAPFWNTWWFYLLMAALAIVIIKFYYEYRVHKHVQKLLLVEKIRTEEQHNVRRKMAQDFHDNMGNQLASITVYVNLISMKLKDSSAEITDILKNIEKHSKSLFTGTKDFIWSMDPESDELHEVFTYIKDFGEELYQNTPMQFYSKISGEVPALRILPSGYSRQIALIFKEAMTNVLKHSNGDKVHFTLAHSQGKFEFRLQDNGSLPLNGESPRGKGLKYMQSRAIQINADLTFTYNEGMRVLLKF